MEVVVNKKATVDLLGLAVNEVKLIRGFLSSLSNNVAEEYLGDDTINVYPLFRKLDAFQVHNKNFEKIEVRK